MTTPAAQATYTIIRIPRTSPRLADLITKFRHTKLAALEADPTSFASQHITESALPLEVWKNRLSKETTILICVATSGIPLADEDTLIQGEWVGFAAVRGPISYKDYYESADQGLPVPADPNVETRWHVYDLYTLPSHRGRGLAKKLIAGCVDTAVELTRNSSHDHQLLIARIRLFMDRRKAWLVKMYEGLEFEGVGLVTLTEAIRANAFYESLPEDSQSTEELRHKWHARNGLAMERIVHIGQDVA